ncbi:hypothetical protein P3X46_012995 [Hevea brasiliensis]|uniref:NAC domain-containing protein n=1 Tax=Hevea brasiliensis TaxID=3981 RepID=A0ABQ9MEN1_HEVBR|nr:NAC domain-containing protein 104 [Hevea brasiliensis]KAJ9177823.1 hypothetical protein P3X46_012995 [Hevea brasiliensis]
MSLQLHQTLEMGDYSSLKLPPGFRFCPTDQELVLHFLYRKASLLPSHEIIPDLHHLHPLDPWNLHGKALSSGNQWYFFAHMMEFESQQQVTENGLWKQLDVQQPIFSDSGNKIGIKNYLVYYIGQHPAAIETNWMMHQYHLCNSSSPKRIRKSDYHKWVLCRVYQSTENCCQSFNCTDECGNDEDDDDDGTELSCLDEMFLSLEDDLDDISLPN